MKKYVNEYAICQRMKNKTKAPIEKLITNEVLEKL